MSVSRKTELTVGSDAFSVRTELLGDETAIIETRVLRGLEEVYRTETDVKALLPLAEHRVELSHWVDTQHETVVQRLREGSLSVGTGTEQKREALEARLEFALSSLAAHDFTAAARELRRIADQFPDMQEAHELLDVARAGESGEALEANALRKLKAGAQAFAKGSPRRAIEFWKVCLASDPASKTYQCLILLAATKSEKRREKCAQEIISLGGQLLTEGFAEEAHALLLVAQTVEQTEAAKQNETRQNEATQNEPQLEEETILLPARPQRPVEPVHAPPAVRPGQAELAAPQLADDFDFQGGPGTDPMAAAPDTNPRSPGAPEKMEANESPESPMDEGNLLGVSEPAPRPALDFRRLPLPPNVLIGGTVTAVALLVGAFSMSSLVGGRVPVELLDQASASFNAGQYTEATQTYTRILSDWEDVASAHLGRGRARLALGDEEGGLADLTRAVQLEPDAPTSAQELGDVLYIRGRYSEAAEYYLQAVDSGGQDAGARYRLAASLVQLNRSDDALQHLEAALEIDPSHGEARLLLGTLLNAQGRHIHAERELRAARAHIDADGNYFTELGNALLRQGKLDEAEQVARNFVRFDTGDARSHTLLGDVFFQRKQYEPARIELIQALQATPNDPRAQVALAQTWLAIGKRQGDRGDLQKARQVLESAQGVPEAERVMVLGQVALAEGKIREAVTLLEQSLGLGAEELPARLSLADAKYRAKDYEGAATELQRARLFASKDAAIPLSLGITYSQARDPLRASAEYLKAIQLSETRGAETVVFSTPYVSVPRRFDINRSIRSAYRGGIDQSEDDPDATALKALAESTSFTVFRD